MITAKTRVLIVQEHYTVRTIITYILKQTGFKHICSVSNGTEAIKELHGGTYGIVISEWYIQGMDGLCLLKSIREDPELKDMLFIMLTVESDRDKVIEAKGAGVDAYLVKPFTAELLCRRLMDAVKARFPELVKSRTSSVKAAVPQRPSTTTKIFGEAAKSPAFGSGNGWTISLSSLRPKAVVKPDTELRLLSAEFDMLKSDGSFVSVAEMIKRAEATMKNVEEQSRRAAEIASTTDGLNQAISFMKDAVPGSVEAAEALGAINVSADNLSEMVDKFDLEVADVIAMLSAMGDAVRQSNIRCVNNSISAACALETGENPVSAEEETVSAELAGRFEKIWTESGTARESLASAADGINQAMISIRSFDSSARPSVKLFEELGKRIDHIMEALDNQIAVASSITKEVDDTTAVTAEVHASVKKQCEEQPVQTPSPKLPAKDMQKPIRKPPPSAQALIKKAVDHSVTMIDLIKTDHSLCIRNFEEHLINDGAFQASQLPGRPECSLAKWLNLWQNKQDLFDRTLCDEIMLLRDGVHDYARQAIIEHKKGRKEEAVRIYREAKQLSDKIVEMLEDAQRQLRAIL